MSQILPFHFATFRVTGTNMKREDNPAIAPIIARMRDKRMNESLSYEAAAKQMEVAPSQPYRWEQGLAQPSQHSLGRIAKWLGEDLGKLLLEGKRASSAVALPPAWHFDLKMEKEQDEKELVAREAVDVILKYFAEMTQFLIIDGSSTAYFARALLSTWMERRASDELTIRTNNVQVIADLPRGVEAATLQGKSPRVQLEVPFGSFLAGDRATRSPSVLEWIQREAPKSVTVLAVTALDAPQIGPFGRDWASEDIKRTVLESSGALMLLLAASKLGKPLDPHVRVEMPRYDLMRTKWRQRIEKKTDLWVVSTVATQVIDAVRHLYPDSDAKLQSSTQDQNEKITEVKRSIPGALAIQFENACELRKMLGDQFRMVPQPVHG